MAEERKYFVKESMIFNLESMHDKLFVIEMDLDEKKLSFPLEIAGKTINDYDDLYTLKEEADKLQWIAKSRKVTGKEYGRIKAISDWRNMARYTTCLANGMSEKDAGYCFAD